jgi:hypothetical protein
MNLSDMTNEQREEHKIRVCNTIGLDPALGLLDYFWIPQENGFSNLVLYAKRGAAEILREKHNIIVTKLSREDGPGFVCFTAEGVNKLGRAEIAIGSSATDGLKGEKLASAVMTASTRALRRLTMQFAGCGVLDESEIRGLPADNNPPAASQAELAGTPVVMPPPQVVPNAGTGKDITLVVDMGEHLAKVYADGKAGLAAMPVPGQADSAVPVQVDSVTQNPPKEGVSSQETAPSPTAAVAIRRRRTRNQKDISSPGQASAPPATAQPEQGAVGNGAPCAPALAEPVLTPELAKAIKNIIVPQPIAVAPEVPQPNKVVETKTDMTTQPPTVTHAPVVELTEAQKTAYLLKWREYAQNILPSAGKMMPMDSVGGPTMQLRKFVLVTTGSAVTDLDQEQWDEFIGFLDSYSQKNGAPALVEYIQKAILGK